MDIGFVLFNLVWWTNDLGILWYVGYVLWRHGNEQSKSTSAILIYARLTAHLHHVPSNVLLACILLSNIVLLFTVFIMYTVEQKKIVVAAGAVIFSTIPNFFNPFNTDMPRLLIKLFVYGLVTSRVRKQTDLEISKYICWAWVLFAHESCLVLVPLQLIYDTYYYKVTVNV